MKTRPFAVFIATALASAQPAAAQTTDVPAAAMALGKSASPAASPAELVQQAVAALGDNRFADALELTRQAETKAPGQAIFGNENLFNVRGASFVGLRLFKHARREFARAAAAQPKQFDPAYNLAETAFLLGHYKEAVDGFSKLLTTEAGRRYFDFLQYKIGIAFMLAGDKAGFERQRSQAQAQSANESFFTLADALRTQDEAKAELLREALQGQMDAATFALYEDSLIEGGLIDPTAIADKKHLVAKIGQPSRKPLTAGNAVALPEGGAPPEPEPEPEPDEKSPDPGPAPETSEGTDDDTTGDDPEPAPANASPTEVPPKN